MATRRVSLEARVRAGEPRASFIVHVLSQGEGEGMSSAS